MELNETIKGMTSDDYKERFKAEYNQLIIRYNKLNDVIKKYCDGTLEFTLSCDILLLLDQRAVMGSYKAILEHRASIEGIELN